MRLRPLEIKVSVNYARLSINIVRLANTLKLRRPGAWDRSGSGQSRSFGDVGSMWTSREVREVP